MKNQFLLCLVVLLTVNTQNFADEEPMHRQIQHWCQQLGDESYLVRKRAESLLIQTGIQAYYELQRAKQSRDVEVTKRAEYILSQIEQSLLDSESQEVTLWMRFYMMAVTPASKAQLLRVFADPGSDLKKGEGLQTLCRFVRFEENETLRLEAAKCLIASPPFAPSLREKWYRYIRDNIQETTSDPVIACVVRYAKLWCDLNQSDQKTTQEFQDRIRQAETETLQLLNRPENSAPISNKIDLLLHYAVIELQDAGGLIDERDKMLKKVLAIKHVPIPSNEQIEPIISIVDDNLVMSGHCYVGWYLKQRHRLRWALAHFEKVIETGDFFLRIQASDGAADIAIYLADYDSAIAHFDQQIELLNSPEYTKRRSDSMRHTAQAKKRRAYCLAERAFAQGDWKSVRQFILEGWAISDVSDPVADSDLVIMAHRLCREQPDVDTEFKEKMNSNLQQIWVLIENEYNRSSPDVRSAAMINMCNGAAWILANTGGDFESALTFAEIAQNAEPEDAGILDTLAHVYFLGGKFDDAIRVQEQVVRLSPEAMIFRQTLEQFKQKNNQYIKR